MQIIKTHQQTSARRNLQESGFCSLFPQTISLEWTKFSSSRCIPKETLRIITPDKGESNKKCLHRAFGKMIKLKEHVQSQPKEARIIKGSTILFVATHTEKQKRKNMYLNCNHKIMQILILHLKYFSPRGMNQGELKTTFNQLLANTTQIKF